MEQGDVTRTPERLRHRFASSRRRRSTANSQCRRAGRAIYRVIHRSSLAPYSAFEQL